MVDNASRVYYKVLPMVYGMLPTIMVHLAVSRLIVAQRVLV